MPPQGSWVCISCNDVHLLQALYHGKPIVAMPFFADQLPNAEKVVAKVSNTCIVSGDEHGSHGTQCKVMYACKGREYRPHYDRMHCLQGCGVQVQPAESGSPTFSVAINQVLTDLQYTKAAQALSRKLRARKNTPVEEAAGAAVHLHHHQAIIPHILSFSPHRVLTETAGSASASDEHADSLSL